jgi:hypothetical protein
VRSEYTEATLELSMAVAMTVRQIAGRGAGWSKPGAVGSRRSDRVWKINSSRRPIATVIEARQRLRSVSISDPVIEA